MEIRLEMKNISVLKKEKRDCPEHWWLTMQFYIKEKCLTCLNVLSEVSKKNMIVQTSWYEQNTWEKVWCTVVVFFFIYLYICYEHFWTSYFFVILRLQKSQYPKAGVPVVVVVVVTIVKLCWPLLDKRTNDTWKQRYCWCHTVLSCMFQLTDIDISTENCELFKNTFCVRTDSESVCNVSRLSFL